MFLGHTELAQGASTSPQAGRARPGTDSLAGLPFMSAESCVNQPLFCQGFTSFSLG